MPHVGGESVLPTLILQVGTGELINKDLEALVGAGGARGVRNLKTVGKCGCPDTITLHERDTHSRDH